MNNIYIRVKEAPELLDNEDCVVSLSQILFLVEKTEMSGILRFYPWRSSNFANTGVKKPFPRLSSEQT